MTKLEIFLLLALFATILIFIGTLVQLYKMSCKMKIITSRKPDGTLLIGYNRYSKNIVYRFDFDIPLEDAPNHSDLLFKVERTNDNLGINERLYDLSDEGLDDQ